jgi:AraC family transcriptional regulator
VQRTIEYELTTSKASVAVRSFCYNRPAVDVRTHYDDRYFMSVALGPRPPNPRARYQEVWSERRVEQCGECVFVPQGLTMLGACDPGYERDLVLLLNSDLFTLDWRDMCDRALSEAMHVEYAEMKRSIRRIVWELSNSSFSSPMVIDALCIMLAVDIERRLQGVAEGDSRKIGGLSPLRLRKIEERIHSDLPIPALSELADYCGLSLRHLARAFREETGRTIGEYINVAAREKAFDLLRNSDLTIGEIARQAGFSSGASFSYAFRRDTGLKPSDVRKA